MSDSNQNNGHLWVPNFTASGTLYEHLYANPELSQQERETAALIPSELSKIGVKNIYGNLGGHGLAAPSKMEVTNTNLIAALT